MCRPDLTLLPLPAAVTLLARWIAPHVPPKLIHPHEKITDAELIAVVLLQRLHKVPHFSRWWRLLKLNTCPHFPSEPQARIRLARLTPVVEQLATEVQFLDFGAVDSEPLPVSTFKRAPHCKFRGARHGFSTAGPVYGFKLHAWSALNGKIVRYEIRPANEHDFTVLCEGVQRLARVREEQRPHGRLSAMTGPKQIGDKGYQSGTCLTPPKVNAKRVDPRWKPEYGAARKCVESAFSVLVGAGLRWGQVKTYLSLRLKVALNVLAHNLKFIDVSG